MVFYPIYLLGRRALCFICSLLKDGSTVEVPHYEK